MAEQLPPPDAGNREIIAADIDSNLVVEAAAGSGKTTCLVRRLLRLLRAGALASGRRLAAVTFTRKAAAELRERLTRGLSEELEASSGPERENLEAAREALSECHFGTIHSFCSRLLREHPVEAGIGPDFREIDEEEDADFRRRAWDEFARLQLGGRESDSTRVLAAHSLDWEAFRRGFEVFADYPDIDEWLGWKAPVPSPPAAELFREVENYLDGLAPQTCFQKLLASDSDPGSDTLIPALRNLARRRRRFSARGGGLAEALDLADPLPENPEMRLVRWLPFGFTKEEFAQAKVAYRLFYDRAPRLFNRARRGGIYAAVLPAFFQAREIYDRLRREAGRLNFQDLLLRTARLLREFPGLRAELAGRYARLLVDEAQDTDPIQAEIMFLLASADVSEKKWRRCRPRPGALFIVGDPKQSIYRFRRADIAIYQEMKELIRAGGGRIVPLSANFRSQPEIIAWLNQAFGPEPDAGGDGPAVRFSPEDSLWGPAYIPLEPALAPEPAPGLRGVYSLKTRPSDRKAGVKGTEILADEAGRIAGFIRWAVDSRLSLPVRGGLKPASPADFLIITPGKKATAIYAGALRRLGLACRRSGGASLADSPTLDLLADYLGALAAPDDPVPTLAVLRGGLFGLSDPELYAWKKMGGVFLFAETRPAGIPDNPVGQALQTMAGHSRLFRTLAPARALDSLMDDLGLWPHACLGEDPAAGAGIMAAAVELLRAEGGGIPTLGRLAARLAWLRERHETEPLPARAREAEAVRVMNVHKSKGLESPVVFLTCTRNERWHPPDLAISRDGERSTGVIRIRGGANNSPILAQPEDWEKMETREGLFLQAEKIRLNYVAATRAEAILVVSLHLREKKWFSSFIPGWRDWDGEVRELPEPDSSLVRPGGLERWEPVDPDLLSRPAAIRAARTAARPPAVPGTAGAKPEAAGGRVGEEAADYGEILHRLLAGGYVEAGRDELAAAAAGWLSEKGHPPGKAAEIAELILAARDSGLWRRTLGSERVLREIPYSLPLAGPEGERLERGIIDLVFRENAGWVVVDYKSGRPAADNPEAAAEHLPQLRAYASAWARITGEKVVETGIFFLSDRQYIPFFP
ncbi:MAG: UvrD-helicase domain-containing protein [Planctomycetota bacterium]|jgi:ATP-dependent helicase/nuclease subunit A|nr:UvrD-helicase domain-containing protein [Planctomycetota bacterium]